MQISGTNGAPVYKFFFNKNSKNLPKLEQLFENAKRKKKPFLCISSEPRKNDDVDIRVIPPNGYNKKFEDACETVGLSYEKYTGDSNKSWIA